MVNVIRRSTHPNKWAQISNLLRAHDLFQLFINRDYDIINKSFLLIIEIIVRNLVFFSAWPSVTLNDLEANFWESDLKSIILMDNLASFRCIICQLWNFFAWYLKFCLPTTVNRKCVGESNFWAQSFFVNTLNTV